MIQVFSVNRLKCYYPIKAIVRSKCLPNDDGPVAAWAAFKSVSLSDPQNILVDLEAATFMSM